jgi:hypothetical protein
VRSNHREHIDLYRWLVGDDGGAGRAVADVAEGVILTTVANTATGWETSFRRLAERMTERED